METMRAAGAFLLDERGERAAALHDKPGAYGMNMNSGDQASQNRVLFGERVTTARRDDGEGGVSLARRRAWYWDADGTGGTTQNAGGTGGTGQDSNAGGTNAENVDALPPWAQKMIRDLRDEAATRRVELKRWEDKEKARLEKMGEWETLAKQAAQKAAELEPRAVRAESLDTFVKQSLEARVKLIPETMRSLVPNFPDPLETMRWLDANESKLRTPAAPNMDAGASGSNGGMPNLTAEELRLAKEFGLDPAKVAKQKKDS